MAIHSSILAWEIPWTKEPGGPQSIGLQSQTRLSTLIYASLFSMAVPRSIKAMSSTSSSKHEHLINYFFKKKRNCFSWLALRKQVQQLTDSTFSWTCHGQGLMEVMLRCKMQKLPSHFLMITLSQFQAPNTGYEALARKQCENLPRPLGVLKTSGSQSKVLRSASPRRLSETQILRPSPRPTGWVSTF